MWEPSRRLQTGTYGATTATSLQASVAGLNLQTICCKHLAERKSAEISVLVSVKTGHSRDQAQKTGRDTRRGGDGRE